MMAPDTIRQYYLNQRFFGRWPLDQEGVVTVRAGSQSAGEVMQLQAQCVQSKITDMRIQVYGCGYAIAALSYVAAYCCGKFPDELILTAQKIMDVLELPATKKHSALLAEQVLLQLRDELRKLSV